MNCTLIKESKFPVRHALVLAVLATLSTTAAVAQDSNAPANKVEKN
jgi:hypothetical protein